MCRVAGGQQKCQRTDTKGQPSGHAEFDDFFFFFNRRVETDLRLQKKVGTELGVREACTESWKDKHTHN